MKSKTLREFSVKKRKLVGKVSNTLRLYNKRVGNPYQYDLCYISYDFFTGEYRLDDLLIPYDVFHFLLENNFIRFYNVSNNFSDGKESIRVARYIHNKAITR